MPRGPEYSEANQEWRTPPKPQPESAANPFALLLRDQRGGRERSHEEIVASIRKEMASYLARKGPIYQFDPVAWMREELSWELSKLRLAQNPEPPTGGRYDMPYAQLMMAWDLISQPHYKSAHLRGLTESAVKDDARHLGHTIMLTPNEGKLLSAMAEAVGIPNPLGPMTPVKQAPK